MKAGDKTGRRTVETAAASGAATAAALLLLQLYGKKPITESRAVNVKGF